MAETRYAHKQQRTRLRQRLERRGLPTAEINQAVEQLRQRQAARRRHLATEKAVAQVRDRMAAAGAAPWRIDRAVAQVRAHHDAAHRAGVPPQEFDATVRKRMEAERPDDSRHRPTTIDPLLRGPARVTTRTAKAAARRRATTRYELTGAS